MVYILATSYLGCSVSSLDEALAVPLLVGVEAAKCPSTDGFSAANIPTTNPVLLSRRYFSAKQLQDDKTARVKRVPTILNQVPSCYYLDDTNLKRILLKIKPFLLLYFPHTPLVYPTGCLALPSRNWRECVISINSRCWLVRDKSRFCGEGVCFMYLGCAVYQVNYCLIIKHIKYSSYQSIVTVFVLYSRFASKKSTILGSHSFSWLSKSMHHLLDHLAQ